MHPGRGGGLLLTVLLAASTLENAVDARRTLNKCCAPNEQLYFNMDSNLYRCETTHEKLKQDELTKKYVDNVDRSKTTTAFARDTGNTSKFARKFLEVPTNVSFNEDDAGAGVFPPCFSDATEDFDYLFAPDGFRLRTTSNSVTLLTPGNHEFEAHAWCLDLDDDDEVMAVVCPCLGADKPCVRKCCADDKVFDQKSKKCVASNLKPWEPTTRDSNVAFYKMKITPTCKIHGIEKFRQDQLTLLSDGSIKGRSIKGRSEKFAHGKFCVDATSSSNASDTDGDLLVLFCIEIDPLSDAVTIFKGSVTLLGALALFITVALTAVFPEMRQHMHGKIALCHNASLLVAFTCIGASQVAGNRMNEITCKVFSFVMQYTLLAAFFWLNVMCFDLSWAFSAMRPVKEMVAGQVDRKFMWYTAYAWGTTSLISIATMLVEFVPGAKLKPRFGEGNCFFYGDDKIPQLLFLFGPMAILLAINVGLFVFTATKIITHRQQTSILKNKNSNTNNRNQRNLILYVKLFTLMGVTWIFEIISWAVGGKNYYWLVFDCVNLLRGVFIFFIFCCKRSVLDMVRTLFSCTASQEGALGLAGTKTTAPSGEVQKNTLPEKPATSTRVDRKAHRAGWGRFVVLCGAVFSKTGPAGVVTTNSGCEPSHHL